MESKLPFIFESVIYNLQNSKRRINVYETLLYHNIAFQLRHGDRPRLTGNGCFVSHGHRLGPALGLSILRGCSKGRSPSVQRKAAP